MAQSADKAYAEPIHQRLFLYFDTSRLQAAFGLVDPPTSGSGLFRVTLHLRFPRLPGGGAGRGDPSVGELLVGDPCWSGEFPSKQG